MINQFMPIIGSGASAPSDPNFKNVTLLLRGEGANGYQNYTFVDNSPNDIKPTRTGDLTQGTFSAFSKTAGKWSTCFDGSADFLYITNNSAYQFGSGNWTIEFWINPNAFSAAQVIVSHGYGSPNTNRSYVVYIESTTGLLRLAQSTTGSDNFDNSTGITLTSGSWQHVAIVRNGANITSYLNGVASGTTITAYTLYASSSLLIIGGQIDAAAVYLSGYISNFRIVKGTAVYTGNFTVPTTPLTAITNTQVLICQDRNFKDNSPNNFTLNRSNEAAITAYSPFSDSTPYTFASLGYSAFFDSLDATKDSLRIADSENLRLGSGDFTLEYWIRPTSFFYIADIYAKGNNTTGANGIIIQNSATTGAVSVAGNGSLIITSNTNSTLNSWQHYALVRNGSAMTLYRNGSNVGSAINTTNFSNTNFALVGGTGLAINNYLTGYLSNFRIVKGTAVYTSNFTPPTSKLTAISGTQLLAFQDDILKDNSPNNGLIEIRTGTPITSSYDPFSNTYPISTTDFGSMYFDGSGDYLSYGTSSGFTFGTGDFTVEAWVYIEGSNFNIFNVGGAVAGSYSLYWLSSDRKFQSVRYGDTAGSGTTTNTYEPYQWLHIAAVRSGGTAKLYINGVADAGAQYAMGSVTASAGESGRSFQTVTATKGYISNLRVVNGSAVYTGNFTPPTTKLTSITNTQLLIDGTNAGVIDSSRNINLYTLGNAQSRTNIKKFNEGSIYFDGSGDYLVAAGATSSYLYSFGAADFTVEFWVYFNSTSGFVPIVANGLGVAGGTPTYESNWSIFMNIGNLYMTKYVAGVQTDYTFAWSPSTSQWYHVAIARSGTSLRAFIDGTQIGTTQTSSLSFSGATNNPGFSIGRLLTGINGSVSSFLNGYIDELRITKGVARYTANFTAPIDRFPGA